MPSGAPEANRKSLLNATSDVVVAEVPPGVLTANEILFQALLEKGGGGLRPDDWIEEDRLPTPAEVAVLIGQMNNKSNAGFPYCLSGQKKREFCEENFDMVYQLLCERLLRLAEACDELEAYGPPDPRVSWEAMLVDPVFVIEKEEGLKKEKVDRQRLVVCGTCVDELVDRVVGQLSAKQIKATDMRSWAMVGVGFWNERLEAVKEEIAELEAMADDDEALAESDVKGYEFRHQWWDYVADAHYERVANGLRPGTFYYNVVGAREAVCARNLYVFGDGELWA